MIRLVLGATALAAGLAASPAEAEVKTLAQAGAWEAFGGTAANGQQLCGASTLGDGKYIGIKYFKGDPALTIQLSSTGWKVTDGDKVPVTMTFDNQPPWRSEALSYHMSDGDSALQFEIDGTQLGRWTAAFRQSRSVVMAFPTQKVEDWRVNLRGTSVVADSLAECLRLMKTS